MIGANCDLSSPKCKDAHLVGKMELAGPIEVEDCVEGARVPANCNHSKELVCFKVLVKLRSRPVVGVLLDIRMGSNVDQNPLATGY